MASSDGNPLAARRYETVGDSYGESVKYESGHAMSSAMLTATRGVNAMTCLRLSPF